MRPKSRQKLGAAKAYSKFKHTTRLRFYLYWAGVGRHCDDKDKCFGALLSLLWPDIRISRGLSLHPYDLLSHRRLVPARYKVPWQWIPPHAEGSNSSQIESRAVEGCCAPESIIDITTVFSRYYVPLSSTSVQFFWPLKSIEVRLSRSN